VSSLAKSGITRRIDELGRIVVPKEIRYNLGIRDGEPLEIYVENKSIVIKKYSQIENIKDISQKIADIISDSCNVDICISDREKFIASNKQLNTIINNKLDNKYKKLIDDRESYISEKIETIFNISCYVTIIPIITSTDCSGLIFILSKTNSKENLKYAKIVQKLIIQKLEIS